MNISQPTLVPSDEELISNIYEAAVLPEFWPAVLSQLSTAADGAGGLLFTANLERMRWTASSDIYDLFDKFIRDGWAAINPRPARMGALNHAGFVRDSDCFTTEELEREPVYQEFLRKHGLGWATGTMVSVPTGDSIIFSFERQFEKGPVSDSVVERFDRLRPHLARSALLSARLGLARAQAMADALEAVGLPAAVLRRGGRLLASNAGFAKWVPSVFVDRAARLELTDSGADTLFVRAVAGADSNAALVSINTINSIPLAAAEDRPPMIVHVLPVCGAAHDIFSQASSLLVVTPVDRVTVPNAVVLQGLFDLTPAEARVARAIGKGETVDLLSSTLKLSRETVRSQLKAVLEKTGMRRQSDLVAMLASVSLRTDRSEGSSPRKFREVSPHGTSRKAARKGP